MNPHPIPFSRYIKLPTTRISNHPPTVWKYQPKRRERVRDMVKSKSQPSKCLVMFFLVDELIPTVEQGVEISSIEIGPRTDCSTKFQLVPSTPINTIYSISFDDIDSGIGVFLELEVEAGGTYRLAKKTIQKALSRKVAENTVEIINEILEEP